MTMASADPHDAATAAAAAQLVNDQGEQVGPHECQNGHGARARFVLTDLDDSSTDLLCGACMFAMMLAVASQIPPPEQVADDDTAGAGA